MSGLRDQATAGRRAAIDAGHEPSNFELADRDRALAVGDRRNAAEDRIEFASERAASHRDRIDSESAARRALEALESMSDAFFTVDHHWRITYMNPQSSDLLDQRRDTLIGQSIWEAFPAVIGTPLEAAMLRAAHERGPARVEATYEGRGVTLDMRIHAVSEGLAVYYSDVTEERERDARHRQAERMELLGQLTAGVAHDFNNYLLVIRSFAELGQAASQDEQVSSYFEKVAFASAQGTALTRQLRAFGTEQEFDPIEVDLNDVVRNLWSLLDGMLPHGIELVLKPSAEPVYVFVDRTRIEQVILNLVVNARDAIDGRGSITVITTNEAPGDVTNGASPACGWLQVRDSGSGIDEDIKAHMFDPFFTTKSTARGTGLGLATTHKIVTQSGGTITVDTALDHGTTMTVALPRHETAAEARSG